VEITTVPGVMAAPVKLIKSEGSGPTTPKRLKYKSATQLKFQFKQLQLFCRVKNLSIFKKPSEF
jgi:hypothetical protein